MRHIFISYKHDNLDFAENVKSRLERANFTTWMDDHIHPGEEWRNQIDQAIKNAFAMVVIMSPEARASEYVTYEWSFAVGIGVKLIPIKYKPTSLHPRLEAIQYLDFTSGRPWEKLLTEIEEAAKAPLPFSSVEPNVSAWSFVQQAKAALNKSQADVRKDAIATLAQANSSEAREALLEALSHQIADVRQQAAIALGNTRYQAAIPRLVELLQDSVSDVRIAAIDALEMIRDASVLPALLIMLNKASVEEKIRIVGVIGTFADISVIATLFALYEKAEAELREAINHAFSKLKSALAIPTLKEALCDPERNVCKSAAKALLQIGSDEAIHAMVGALLAMSKAQCEVVSHELSSAQLDKLIVCLEDVYREHLPVRSVGAEREKNAKVRRRIIFVLSLFMSNKGVPTLILAMDDEDLVVQQSTIIAFKNIKDERVLPALMTILRWRCEDYDEKTLLYAIQALRQIGNVSIIPQLKVVLDKMLEKHTDLAVQVIDVFGCVGDYEIMEYLRKVKLNVKLENLRQSEKEELAEAIEQAISTIRARW